MPRRLRTLYLCAGLQSSGSTLISWCFLQRADMDGILDANNDILADLPAALAAPYAWIKTTVSSFRVSEQLAYFEDLGWRVRPLLICRDVREVYASLRTKRYAINGTTAEDPPLRLRLRRFREDWELFRRQGWPVLQYEQFQRQPEEVLRDACRALDLPWDDAMLTWPKPKAAILDTRHGNQTFRKTCSHSLLASLSPTPAARPRLVLPAGESAWLDQEFAHFNEVNGYPAHLATMPPLVDEAHPSVPCYQGTRRARWRMQLAPFHALGRKVARWFKRAPATAPQPRLAPALPCQEAQVRVLA